MKKEEKDKDKQKRKSKSTRSLKEKMHKHISDKNDVITDDDMKNVKVGEESFQEPGTEEHDLPKEINKESDELNNAFSQKEIINPWDIIDEDDNK
jgi:hypothetical protein